MIKIDKIIKSPTKDDNYRDLWIDNSDSDAPVLKTLENGEWKVVGGSGGSDSGGSSSGGGITIIECSKKALLFGAWYESEQSNGIFEYSTKEEAAAGTGITEEQLDLIFSGNLGIYLRATDSEGNTITLVPTYYCTGTEGQIYASFGYNGFGFEYPVFVEFEFSSDTYKVNGLGVDD